MPEGSGIHKAVSTSPHFPHPQEADDSSSADPAQQQTAVGADFQDSAPPLKKRRTGNAEATAHVSTKKTEIESLEDQYMKQCDRLAELQGKQEITFRLREIQQFMVNPGRFDASECGFEIKYVSSSGRIETLIPPEQGMSEDRKKLLINMLSSRIGEIKESFVDNGRDTALDRAIEDEKINVAYTAHALNEQAPYSNALHYESPNSSQYEITANLSNWPPSPSEGKENGHFLFEVKSPNGQSDKSHRKIPMEAKPGATPVLTTQPEEKTNEGNQGKRKLPPVLADLPNRRKQLDEDWPATAAHADTVRPLPFRRAGHDIETARTTVTPAQPGADVDSSLSSTTSDSLSTRGEYTSYDVSVYEPRLFNEGAINRIFAAQKQHQPDTLNHAHAGPAGNDIYSHQAELEVIADAEEMVNPNPVMYLLFEGQEGTTEYARTFKNSLTEEFKKYIEDSNRGTLEDITDTEVFNILYNTFSRVATHTDIPGDFAMVLDINEDKWLINQKNAGNIRALYAPQGATGVQELQVDNTNTGVATQLACEISGKPQVDAREVEKAKQQCAISKLPPRPDKACFLILQGTGADKLMNDHEILDLINDPVHWEKDIADVEDDVCNSLEAAIEQRHGVQSSVTKPVVLIY